MSKLIESYVWGSEAIQDKTQLLVMLVIADAANDEGVGIVTQSEIATKCRTVDRTVRRSIVKLKEAGILSWTYEIINDSPHNVYRVNTTALTTRTGCPHGTRTGCPQDHPDTVSYSITNNNRGITVSKGKAVRKKEGKESQGPPAIAKGSAQPPRKPLMAYDPSLRSSGAVARIQFTPPLPQEVKAYAAESSLKDHAEPFIDYYEANGWVQGKARKPLKSWQAAYRQWCRREVEFKGTNGFHPEEPVKPFGSGYKLQPFK